ncbi:MAG TPA: hypothetical protein VM240_11885 [Verrucomicrobiae bacterium]|nr:hypothetical protein [Verrucomicrobiae bacterium]
MKKFAVMLAVMALAVAGAAAADKDGKHKDKGHPDKATAHGSAGKGSKKFEGGERDEVRGWYAANPHAINDLPPGLAKKGKIPPGWQKKVGVGQRVPDDIWEFRVPLPHEVLVKLPPPPPGVIHVRIHDRVLKVIEKTHEVLDDIGLPHPPTPR